MAVADVRRFTGTSWGPVRAARIVDLAGGDFDDPRGFVFNALAAGDYTYRPESASVDLTVTLAVGGYPTVAGVACLCSSVRSGTGLSILVANI